MSKMKYQKEFEELASNNPDLLGGNTLAIQTEHYGVPLDTPEYASSYVRLTYNIFCKVKEQLEQELQKENKIMQEALEFYANGDNYGHISPEIATYSVIDDCDLGIGDFMLNETVDDERVGGKRAREALAKVKK